MFDVFSRAALGALLVIGTTAPRYEIPAHLSSIVALIEGSGASAQVFCTGFVAKPGVVITAAHCVEDAVAAGSRFVNARFVGGREEQLFLLAHGEVDERDFAVLVGSTGDAEPLEFSGAKAEPLTPCVVIGHGGGSPSQNATACVTSVETDGYLGLSATIIGGDSGSPVIDSNSGKVIGVVVRSSYPFPFALAVWSPLVLAAMEKALSAPSAVYPAAK